MLQLFLLTAQMFKIEVNPKILGHRLHHERNETIQETLSQKVGTTLQSLEEHLVEGGKNSQSISLHNGNMISSDCLIAKDVSISSPTRQMERSKSVLFAIQRQPTFALDVSGITALKKAGMKSLSK